MRQSLKITLFLFLILALVINHPLVAQFNTTAYANGRAKVAHEAHAINDYQSDSTIDVTYYKLKLTINPPTPYLLGETMISVKAKRANLTNFFLDLSDTLKTDSVRLGSQKVPFLHQRNQLKITLDKPYELNEEISVTVYYQGKPEKNNSFTFGTHGEGKDQFPIVATLSQPFGTKDWFPSKNTPGDKADSCEVWITAPCGYVSASNGKLVRIVENTTGTSCTKTYQWKSNYPIAAYLISIASTNYKEYDIYYKYSEKDSMIITNYVYPENFTSQTKAQIDSTLIIMDFLTKKLGPYPFLKEKYGHAQTNIDGGMEHQTCSSMSNFSASLIMHELAHQWFGDKITNKSWEHIWLQEGFAVYFELLLSETNGSHMDYLDQGLSELASDDIPLITGSIYVRDPTKRSEIFNLERTYHKGSIVVYMLRKLVGDDVFYKILQTYLRSKLAYGVATTEDFQAIAEQVSGQSLDYFFREWIYGENYPQYSYQWSYQGDNSRGYTVRLKVDQEKNTTPAFYTMPIRITTQSRSGKKESHMIFNNSASQEFLFHVDEKPDTLLFDSNYNVIMKTVLKGEFISSPVLGLEEVDNNWSTFPNPVENDVSINLHLNKASQVKIDLCTSAGTILRTFINEKIPAGTFEASFPIKGLSSGLYILRLTKNEQTSTKKIITH